MYTSVILFSLPNLIYQNKVRLISYSNFLTVTNQICSHYVKAQMFKISVNNSNYNPITKINGLI